MLIQSNSFISSGTIDDCELVEGLVLTQKVANTGVTRVEKAKIGLIQFCLSAPKTDVSLSGSAEIDPYHSTWGFRCVICS